MDLTNGLECIEESASEVSRLKEEQKADSAKLNLMVEAQEGMSKCNEELRSKLAESQEKCDSVSKDYDEIDARLKSEIEDKEAFQRSLIRK